MMMADVLHKQDSNLHPFQPFVSKYISSYQEYQMSWNPYCIKKDALFYQFQTGDDVDDIELVPDACLNVLVDLDVSNPCALFSGTFLHPMILRLKPNTTYFGFKPYSNLGFKSPKINLREMVGTYVDFIYAFPCAERLIADMSEEKEFDGRICIFKRFAGENLIDYDYSPTFLDYLTIMICSSNGNIIFNNMESVIGYTERHCREKFKDCHGLSPKQYSGIMRFQNTLKVLVSGSYKDLSSLALDCGYFDQAHFTRDFRRFTNAPPDKYLKRHLRC